MKSFKRPIPAALGQRYEARMTTLNAAANRRERYILAATFLARVLGLLGLIVLLLARHP